jgi:hypothetical protein
MNKTPSTGSKAKWKSKAIALGFALTSLMATSGAAAQAVETNTGIGVETALAAVTSINDTSQANDVLKQVAEVATDAQGISAIDAKVSGVSITLPTDPSNSVVMQSASGVSLSIDLPKGESADNNVVLQTGAVAYDANDGSSTAAIVKTDGSIQFSTVIENEHAPSTYTYDFSSSATLTFTVDPQTGSVSVTDTNGKWVGGIAPAWAMDSKGKKVETFYTLEGSSLTQHVDFTQPGVTFPIVADPWLGMTLVDHTSWISNPPVGPTLQVFPTPFARSQGFISTPVNPVSMSIFESFWTETLSKTATTGHPTANTGTMYVQLACHFYFVSKVAPNKPSYNLDTNRPYLPLLALATVNCNA